MNAPESPRAEPQLTSPRLDGPGPDNTGVNTSVVAQLRAELELARDPLRKARLLYEIGELEERGGRPEDATRDYLASFNAAPEFHESLEGLVRTLRLERSPENLGRLFETLTTVVEAPAARARAFVARALYLERDAGKPAEAKDALEEAIKSGAGPNDVGPAFLLLESVAARLQDPELREEALRGRAALDGDRSWRALLLVDAAALALASGAEARAVERLEQARELGGTTTYAATRALAELAAGRTSEDPAVAAELAKDAATALAAEAELIVEAKSSGDRGAQLGVPRATGLPVAVERLLRASSFGQSAGDLERAKTLLERALVVLGEHEGPTAAEAPPSTTRRLLLAARIRLADAMGDAGAAARDAAQWLPHEEDAPLAAALALCVAEEAAGRGALAEALDAVASATSRDPACIPARALQLDLLADGADVGPFVERLSELADTLPSAGAKGRAALLLAYLAGSRLGDALKVREALAAATATGVPPETTARLGRSLALLLANDGLYEECSAALLEAIPDSEEAALVAFELVRARIRASDAAGATAARERLAKLPGGADLARELAAFLPGHASPQEAQAAIDVLDARRAPGAEGLTLGVLSALGAARLDDGSAAVQRARVLAEQHPGDAFLGFLYADLARRHQQDPIANAALLDQMADALADSELGAALHLEAGFLRFRAGRAADAATSFDAARRLAPEAANVAHAWSLRGQNLDAPEARRHAVEEASAHAGAAEWALERFANGLVLRDPHEVQRGLEDGLAATPPVALAAALGVLTVADAESGAPGVEDALGRIAALGPAAALFAAGERARVARDGSHEDLAEAASGWFAAGGGLSAALEWLSAAISAGGGAGEVVARTSLAEAVQDEAREGVAASARLLGQLLDPTTPQPLVAGTTHAVRLANLELSPPGSDPRRRAAALNRLGTALGDDTDADVAGLSAWSTYYAGDKKAALELFRAASAARPSDLAAWEGVRSCALDLGEHAAYATACEQLGARARNATRGAVFWEQAGLTWLDLGQEASAEAALDQSIHRDPSRPVAFDKLFRRVRDRKDSNKVLELVERRLSHTDDTDELARLYWEQSRALREKGDLDGALYALENVRTIDPDHVGALALLGEIHIRRGRYEEAAAQLSRLANVGSAPAKNRVTAGVAAVDLYENKLGRNDLALAVLQVLHRDGISTLPVRERLARAAARTSSWEPAAAILEELMRERESREGRTEAARLAMVIYRDRIRVPGRALAAVAKLLEESPTDGEGLEFLVEHDVDRDSRRTMLERGQTALLEALQREPGDPANARRLARVARALGEAVLEHAALAIAVATNGPDPALEQPLAQLAAGKPRTPQLAMTEALLRRILAPGDDGPQSQLFALLGPTIAEALGPTLATLGVSKRERVDPRSGTAIRNEIAAWAGAFGMAEFELYVGGRDPNAVQGVPGELPALVVGAGVQAPLSPLVRSRVARELLGMTRGTVITRWRDDTAIAAIAVAACNVAKVRIEAPPYAILAEVERALGKAISRKTRNAIEPICQALAQAPRDTKSWVPRAIASQHRISAIASGDVSVVLSDAFGLALPDLVRVAREDLRCAELIRFALTPDYFDIRRLLGLETSS